jgi:hypothetical protein
MERLLSSELLYRSAVMDAERLRACVFALLPLTLESLQECDQVRFLLIGEI